MNYKSCNERFHACGSCGLNGWENHFCNQDCFLEFKKKHLLFLKDNFKELLENKNLCQKLSNLIDDPDDYDRYRLDIFFEFLKSQIKC